MKIRTRYDTSRGTSNTDWMTQENAQRLARKITDYWAARGYSVSTQVIPQSREGDFFNVVRSDMVNGMPVRKLLQRAA